MGTIPARIDANVIPGVLGAGGTALDAIGLFLDNSTEVPIDPLGAILSFPSAPAVADYFGAGSSQAEIASVYFNGFEGRTAIPSAILFTQYPAHDVAAYLRGGLLTETLADLQEITAGSLTVVIDGYTHVIASIDLSGDASLSAIAAALTAAFTNPTEASFTASMGSAFTASRAGTTLTVSAISAGYLSAGDVVTHGTIQVGTLIVSQLSGSPGGIGTYQTDTTGTASSGASTATSSVLNVTICASPDIAVGQTVVMTSIQVGTLITTQISGTAGGVGLYQTEVNGVKVQQTVASAAGTSTATAPIVTYNSNHGAFVITSGICGGSSLAAFATGTLAIPLALTLATGAVLSQGAAMTTPSAFMTALIAQEQNFISFTTTFDPDGCFFNGTIATTTLTVDDVYSGELSIGDVISGPGVTEGTIITALVSGTGGTGTYTVSPSQTVATLANMTAYQPGGVHGNEQKLAFAAWNNSVPDEFLYAGWDTDVSPTLNTPAAASFGYICMTGLQYQGTVPIWEPDNTGYYHEAFLMGSIASINFNETNGRTNMKFRRQTGLVPSVTSETVATNLGSGESDGVNGYNCVGAVATATNQNIYWRNGQISGDFSYIDSYVNQVWLNKSMQAAVLNLMLTIKSLPYNQVGYDMVAGALTGGAAQPIQLPASSPVAAALNFGAIRPNIPLSATQAEAVNNAAGTTIDGILSTRGWYLQVLPPPPEVRAVRGSPICNFWYTDGGSINHISLASIELE